MFCENCGTKLNSNDEFCPNCGCKVSTKPPASVISEETTAISKNPVTSLKFFLVIAMACFFFPFITVSCEGESVTASGVEIMTTISLQNEYDFSGYRSNLYLYATVALAVIAFVTAKKGKSLAAPGLASLGATVSLILFRFNFYSYYGIEGLKASSIIEFRWGWWLSLLSLLWASLTALVMDNE